MPNEIVATSFPADFLDYPYTKTLHSISSAETTEPWHKIPDPENHHSDIPKKLENSLGDACDIGTGKEISIILSGCGFKYFSFSPLLGEMIIRRAYFSDGFFNHQLVSVWVVATYFLNETHCFSDLRNVYLLAVDVFDMSSWYTCFYVYLHDLVAGLGHSLDAAGGHRDTSDLDLVTPFEHHVGSEISGTTAVIEVPRHSMHDLFTYMKTMKINHPW